MIMMMMMMMIIIIIIMITPIAVTITDTITITITVINDWPRAYHSYFFKHIIIASIDILTTFLLILLLLT